MEASHDRQISPLPPNKLSSWPGLCSAPHHRQDWEATFLSDVAPWYPGNGAQRPPGGAEGQTQREPHAAKLLARTACDSRGHSAPLAPGVNPLS